MLLHGLQMHLCCHQDSDRRWTRMSFVLVLEDPGNDLASVRTEQLTVTSKTYKGGDIMQLSMLCSAPGECNQNTALRSDSVAACALPAQLSNNKVTTTMLSWLPTSKVLIVSTVSWCPAYSDVSLMSLMRMCLTTYRDVRYSTTAVLHSSRSWV